MNSIGVATERRPGLTPLERSKIREGILGSRSTCEAAQQSVSRFLPPRGPRLSADEFWDLVNSEECIKYKILKKAKGALERGTKKVYIMWKCKIVNMTRHLHYTFPVSVECVECGWVRATQFCEKCPNEKCKMCGFSQMEYSSFGD